MIEQYKSFFDITDQTEVNV